MGVAAVTIWSDSLDSIYSSPIAVEATLAPDSSPGAVTVSVIDKTIGIEIVGDNASEMTIKPAAYIRMSELTANGLARGDLNEGTLTINGKAWRIKAHALRPSPDGELTGEVCVFLMDEGV
jgi:hypothetical protein